MTMKRRRGITVFEIIVAIAVAALMMEAIFGGILVGLSWLDRLGRRQRALAVAESQMELVCAAAPGTLAAGVSGLSPGLAEELAGLRDAAGSVTVSEEPGCPGMKRVEVAVTWREGKGPARETRLVTLRR